MVKEEVLTESDVDFSLLSKDKRFENLTNQFFGELKVLAPYKKEGNTLKWVVECSCGNIVKTSRTKLKHRGKSSCVACSESKLRDKNSTSISYKKEELGEVRPDLRVLSIHGDTWTDNWKVQCNLCEEVYTKMYRGLMLGSKGCSCRKYKRKNLENKLPLIDIYCKKNGYDFLGWDLRDRIKVKLYCPKHKVKLTPYFDNIVKGRLCCKACCKEQHKPYNLKTLKGSIEDAQSVHGVGMFNYDLVEYKNSNTKVKITCNSCQTTNLQSPANHLSGRGCNSCTKYGFNPEGENYWVYLMKLEGLCEDWYKVGITNNLKTRLYNISRGNWYDVSYIDFKKVSKGYHAFQIEQNILSKLKTKGTINPRYNKEGNTEIFQPKELPLVEHLLEEEFLKWREVSSEL